jgi:hypothetical protein
MALIVFDGSRTKPLRGAGKTSPDSTRGRRARMSTHQAGSSSVRRLDDVLGEFLIKTPCPFDTDSRRPDLDRTVGEVHRCPPEGQCFANSTPGGDHEQHKVNDVEVVGKLADQQGLPSLAELKISKADSPDSPAWLGWAWCRKRG